MSRRRMPLLLALAALAVLAPAVRADDDEASLAARVQALEHRIYPLALRLLAEGRVRVAGGRCLIDGAPGTAQALVVPDI